LIDNILNASLKILATKGYENATIADISKAAHVSRGILHYYFSDKEEEYKKLQNSNNVYPSSSSSYKLPYSMLDRNPSLINEDGNINNNINLIASIKTCRNGTIADGVSKLLLVVDSNNPLQFSINVTKPNDLTNGTLSCLNQTNVDKLGSTTKVIPEDIGNVRSVVAAVYTPPDSYNNQGKEDHRTINVSVKISNPTDSDASMPLKIPIQLYRPPVVLIHGVWTNSEQTWAATDSIGIVYRSHK
jgi:hypothetical protein